MSNFSPSQFASMVDQYRHPGSNPDSDVEPGPFITISRESGSGGTRIAKLLAPLLDLRAPGHAQWAVFDSNLMSTVLESHHLPPDLAKYLPEDRIHEFESSIGEMMGLHPNLYNLVQKTNETIRHLALKGNVILVGRGSSFATVGMSHGFHVRIVAPAELRAQSSIERYRITEEQAMEYNADNDAAKRRYVKAYFNADISNPANYDLVINTGSIPIERAAEMIACEIEARVPSLARH